MCRWAIFVAYLKARNTRLWKSFESNLRRGLLTMVDILNIRSSYNAMPLHYFRLNNVILLCDCLNIFEHAEIAKWWHYSANNF